MGGRLAFSIAMTTTQIGFHVDPKFGLGLDICIVNGVGYVENVHPQGSVSEWNTCIASKLQVCRGDRIEGWKEVKGQRESRFTVEEEFYLVPGRAIILKFTKPFFYVVSVKKPFGFKTMKANCNKAFFLISSIMPTGSIQKWNEENPDKLVSVGDIIVGVNGVRCTASEVPKILDSLGHTVVNFMVLHYLPR